MPDSGSTRSLWAWGSLIVALAATVLAYWLSLAPRPLPASAPDTEFSAERALVHVKAIASEPHPAGSAADDRACQYIQSQLHALGVEMEVVDKYVRSGERGIRNQRAVLGRIRGTEPTKAFAIDAHFDSVPYGPGASDDVSGIATMIETARALKAGSPLKNDIIFAFSDQEEIGGDGTRAVIEHPWFKHVGVVLGLETRGTTGPSLMFETSQENGWVVRELLRSGAHPRTNSLMFDIYNHLPFGSDFGQYKRLVPGMNIAFIDGFCNYHTRLDNPENLDLASLQHHGYYALGLARRLGNISLDTTRAPNATYFNTIGSHVLVYPLSWGRPLTLLAVAFFVATLLFGLIRRRIRVLALLAGIGGFLGALVVAVLVSGALIYPMFKILHEAALYRINTYSLSFLFLASAASFFFTGLLASRCRPQELLGGALFAWTPLLYLLQTKFPGGAYTAYWPLILGSASLLVLCLGPAGGPSPKRIGISTVLALPVMVVIGPLLVMLGYTITPLGGFILCALMVLMLTLLIPQITLVSGPARWVLPGVLGVLGLAAFGGGYLYNQPSAACPRIDCLSYGMDFDTNKAYWLSADRELDGWTRQFFPQAGERETIHEFIPGDNLKYLRSPAPLAPFPRPTLEVRDDRIENGTRVLDLFLKSPRHAIEVKLKVTSRARVFGAMILGHSLGGGDAQWEADLKLLPWEGAQLRLDVAPGVPLRINVLETSCDMLSAPQHDPRPDWALTEPNRTLDHNRGLRSEHTFSTCTFDMGTGPASS